MARQQLLTPAIAFSLALLLASKGQAENVQQATAELGRRGEALVREYMRTKGYEVFDLNTGGKGIDALAIRRRPGGGTERVILEIKTRTDGMTFQLSATQEGKQLSQEWNKSKLEAAANKLPNAAGREAASETLAAYRKDPKLVSNQLHGLALKEDCYSAWEIDPQTGKRTSIHSETITGLKKKGSARVRELAAAVMERSEKTSLKSSVEKVIPAAKAKEVTTPTLNQTGKAAAAKSSGKVVKAVAKKAPLVGAAVEAADRGLRAKDTERKYDEGKLTEEERVADHAKNVTGVGSSLAGGMAGAALLGKAGAAVGSFGGPVGTVIGGTLGVVGGGILGSFLGEKATDAAIEAGKGSLYRGYRWLRGG